MAAGGPDVRLRVAAGDDGARRWPRDGHDLRLPGREYGARVWAADFLIPAEQNAARVRADGVGGQVHAVRAEAHDLPFGGGQFDAMVAVDSYHYLGTGDLYLGYLTRFLKPGGLLAIAVPAVRRELRDLGGIRQQGAARRLG